MVRPHDSPVARRIESVKRKAATKGNPLPGQAANFGFLRFAYTAEREYCME